MDDYLVPVFHGGNLKATVWIDRAVFDRLPLALDVTGHQDSKAADLVRVCQIQIGINRAVDLPISVDLDLGALGVDGDDAFGFQVTGQRHLVGRVGEPVFPVGVGLEMEFLYRDLFLSVHFPGLPTVGRDMQADHTNLRTAVHLEWDVKHPRSEHNGCRCRVAWGRFACLRVGR